MSRISSTQPISQPTAGKSSDLENVDVNQFLDLLIAELQNQDPLNPVDNSQFAQQVGQIREIAATDKLSATLNAVLSGQSLGTASGLIGKQVEALSESGETVQGVVERVSVQTNEDDPAVRTYRVHIGDQAFELGRVREVSDVDA